jgi:hypothetical protein
MWSKKAGTVSKLGRRLRQIEGVFLFLVVSVFMELPVSCSQNSSALWLFRDSVVRFPFARRGRGEGGGWTWAQ